MTELPPLDSALLPVGIRSRFADGINGLRMHVLEAGFETPGRPCVLLLHGFPELAFSWRKILPALAATAAPPVGIPTTTATCARSGSSTSCAIPWGWWRPSATPR